MTVALQEARNLPATCTDAYKFGTGSIRYVGSWKVSIGRDHAFVRHRNRLKRLPRDAAKCEPKINAAGRLYRQRHTAYMDRMGLRTMVCIADACGQIGGSVA